MNPGVRSASIVIVRERKRDDLAFELFSMGLSVMFTLGKKSDADHCALSVAMSLLKSSTRLRLPLVIVTTPLS